MTTAAGAWAIGMNYHQILSGSGVTGSYAIRDTSGQYGELLYPTIYDKDGNLDSDTPRTGSVLPSGEYFNIYWQCDGSSVSTGSFIISAAFSR